jgi:enamine deaminase RidA (YjgF/YER057c/UK114 family)
MKLDILEPQGVAQPQGMYNHAIMVSAGRLLFISGQVAIDEANQLVGPRDFNAQIQQVFRNLGSILNSAGASFDNVVKFTTYLAASQNLADFYNQRREIFAGIYPQGRYPANTLVVVDQLARAEWLVEIEAVAALP